MGWPKVRSPCQRESRRATSTAASAATTPAAIPFGAARSTTATAMSDSTAARLTPGRGLGSAGCTASIRSCRRRSPAARRRPVSASAPSRRPRLARPPRRAAAYTAADAAELRKALDDRFRITSEYDDRVRRLREAEAAGGITAADRTTLETLALRERDEALRRIEGTTRRVTAIPRPDREAESARNRTTSSASASG